VWGEKEKERRRGRLSSGRVGPVVVVHPKNNDRGPGLRRGTNSRSPVADEERKEKKRPPPAYPAHLIEKITKKPTDV